MCALLVALASSGCDSPERQPATSLGTVTVGASATPSSAMSSRRKPAKPPAQPTLQSAKLCRATAVEGKVTRTDDGKPLGKHDRLDDAPWLDLGEGARLTVTHARTRREVRLEGPGRVLPCYRQGEAFVVARGTLRATAGSGARPGAEVLVATPHGTVSYGEGGLDVLVRADSLRVTVHSGTATLDAPGASSGQRLTPGGSVQRNGTVPDVKALLASCKEAARRADGEAERVKERDPKGETLGQRAARHFRARRAARKACGIAAAALGTVEPAGERHPLWQALDSAEALWRGLPGPKRPSNNANFR